MLNKHETKCPSCIEKYVKEHKKKPVGDALSDIKNVPAGWLCEVCYREWGFSVAGIPMPPDYQTITSVMHDMEIR